MTKSFCVTIQQRTQFPRFSLTAKRVMCHPKRVNASRKPHNSLNCNTPARQGWWWWWWWLYGKRELDLNYIEIISNYCKNRVAKHITESVDCIFTNCKLACLRVREKKSHARISIIIKSQHTKKNAHRLIMCSTAIKAYISTAIWMNYRANSVRRSRVSESNRTADDGRT